MRPDRRLVADEDGFSLMELIVAMAIGSIVLTVLLGIFMNGLSGTTKVTDRIEATQRARIATDRVVMLLQAQVCADGTAPITDAQATSVTFTANIGDVLALPTRYRMRYDATTKTLWEDDFPATKVDGVLSFQAAPSRSRVLIANVQPVNGAFFSYYAFDPTTGLVDQNAPLTPTLSPADVQRVVRVGTAMTAMPERTKTADARSTTITGHAIVGSADPANPNKGPKC
jgi:prepilin-type N-terminal cleavage/methylation domain-containing protein